MFNEKIKELITKNYLTCVKKNYIKLFNSESVHLLDGNGKTFKCYPRWHLIVFLDSSEEYKKFNEMFDKIFIKTFFPNIVKHNSRVIIYVKNHLGKDFYRYVL